ncbi:hypothetical protein K450DRAFT_230050 [Umbelopsis ramanniana AG]|uniref:Zn(2)-C6 fungal-type domain-containing protein n=1 Tax=Umbelopsis ramanniana AG TaxID=1314678 RepID=A0AAD5EEE0_UMBRA|nr:uncharacterized protein K450DRAFT_230050 [Umbelopsis ramanniana AG]KAI8581949.1 hypothetical protein K450DRAFT_230050 [Umbelopsis ramanniana AG]
MYNQNGNVPFSWANVQRSQNSDLLEPENEPTSSSSSQAFNYTERTIAIEHAPYNYYGRYQERPANPVHSGVPVQDLSHRPMVNDLHGLVPVPNWDAYSPHTATQQATAAVQSLEQVHHPTHNVQYHPYHMPHAQAPAWPYYNHPYPDYPQHTRRNSTPPNYPNSDSSEVTVGKAKPPYVIKACASCKASHVACDPGRPCQRCIRLGKTDTCVDATRKKRGRPKNSTKSQQQQATSSMTDSTGSSSAETTPLHKAANRDLPDQLLELSQILGEYEVSSGEQTPAEYPNMLGHSLGRVSSPPASVERRVTPLSPSAVLRSYAMDGHSSIRKQKSLPSSFSARRGSSTSPNSSPKRRHSHRSTFEAAQTNIQPVMLQHHQSVQYPGAQHRPTGQPFKFQDTSFIDVHGSTQTRISLAHTYSTASSAPSRAIHPLSSQFTYTDSDQEIENQNMHHNR